MSSVQYGLIAIVMMVSTITTSIAHEVRPAVADVEVGTDRVTMSIRLTLEALIAGIDLQGLDDTDSAPQAQRYDALRALSPEALEQAFRESWPSLQTGVTLQAGGAALLPEVTDLSIPEPGDLDLPRDSTLHLSAPLPADGSDVTVGWVAAYGPLVIRQGTGEGAYSAYLTDGQLSAPLPRETIASVSGLTAFGQYIVIGFEHIVPKGLDHILFVLGLFFFSLHMRPLLFQVTAFTLAHTVTLALAILGFVTVSPAIVEPLIAASIVYVAVENIFLRKITPWRTAVVFAFGLLHGLGFASVLGEIGLNPARFVTGLIGFNIGVELGQLSVILAAFLLVGLWFGKKPGIALRSRYRPRWRLPPPVPIGLSSVCPASASDALFFEMQLHIQQHPLQFQRLSQQALCLVDGDLPVFHRQVVFTHKHRKPLA